MYLCHTCSIYDYALQQLTRQFHSLLGWCAQTHSLSFARGQFSSAGNLLIPIVQRATTKLEYYVQYYAHTIFFLLTCNVHYLQYLQALIS